MDRYFLQPLRGAALGVCPDLEARCSTSQDGGRVDLHSLLPDHGFPWDLNPDGSWFEVEHRSRADNWRRVNYGSRADDDWGLADHQRLALPGLCDLGSAEKSGGCGCCGEEEIGFHGVMDALGFWEVPRCAGLPAQIPQRKVRFSDGG